MFDDESFRALELVVLGVLVAQIVFAGAATSLFGRTARRAGRRGGAIAALLVVMSGEAVCIAAVQLPERDSTVICWFVASSIVLPMAIWRLVRWPRPPASSIAGLDASGVAARDFRS